MAYAALTIAALLRSYNKGGDWQFNSALAHQEAIEDGNAR